MEKGREEADKVYDEAIARARKVFDEAIAKTERYFEEANKAYKVAKKNAKTKEDKKAADNLEKEAKLARKQAQETVRKNFEQAQAMASQMWREMVAKL